MAATVASNSSLNPHPIQRPLKGSRISSFYPVKELPPLSALDSAFQLQEYISLLIRKDVHDVDAIVSIPGKGKQRVGDGKSEHEDGTADTESGGEGQKESGEGKSEITVDEACWIYEQLRRLAQDLSHPLITMLQQECTRQTCPEMKAGEWLYLCVAHGNEGAMEQCCAIDYILHTLDSATALLNSPRAFPSRLSIPAPSHRHFSSLARRLGRIFAHAYFHHRAAFAQAEAESALYARFLALTSRFDLVPPEFLVIPPGIVGYDDNTDEYPRLLAASMSQRQDPERGREEFARSGAGEGPFSHAGHLVGDEGEGRDPSPRKMGRNRTDTMVHSEIATVVEELGRSASSGDDGQTQEELPERENVGTIRLGDSTQPPADGHEELDQVQEGEAEPRTATDGAEQPEKADEIPALSAPQEAETEAEAEAEVESASTGLVESSEATSSLPLEAPLEPVSNADIANIAPTAPSDPEPVSPPASDDHEVVPLEGSLEDATTAEEEPVEPIAEETVSVQESDAVVPDTLEPSDSVQADNAETVDEAVTLAEDEVAESETSEPTQTEIPEPPAEAEGLLTLADVTRQPEEVEAAVEQIAENLSESTDPVASAELDSDPSPVGTDEDVTTGEDTSE